MCTQDETFNENWWSSVAESILHSERQTTKMWYEIGLVLFFGVRFESKS